MLGIHIPIHSTVSRGLAQMSSSCGLTKYERARIQINTSGVSESRIGYDVVYNVHNFMLHAAIAGLWHGAVLYTK